MTVPAPIGLLNTTLVYLIECDAGYVLVDAGWDHEAGWDALRAGIRATGHEVSECAGVLVTHCHPDHHGLSGRIREVSGCWVAMHPDEAALARRIREVAGPEISLDHAMAFTRSAEDGEPTPSATGRPVTISTPEPGDVSLADGELADIPGRNVRAILTPGHSPGHLCFHLEDARFLLTGDHVLPETIPHIGMWFVEDGADPLGDYLRSLARVQELAVDVALPAHEHPFEDLRGRVSAMLHDQRNRLEAVEAALADGPCGVSEIAEAQARDLPWEDLGSLTRQAVIGETHAQLRHLRALGRVRRVEDQKPTMYELAATS